MAVRAHLLVESELLLIAVTIVRLLALLPGEAGTCRRNRNISIFTTPF